MKEYELQPIREDQSDFDRLEALIRDLFKTEIYLPLVKELGQPKQLISNSLDDVLKAVRMGKIVYHKGTFNGRFNSSIAKELKKLGAKWDRASGSFKLPAASLPGELKETIRSSYARFSKTLQAIDAKLAQVSPTEIAGKLKAEKFFETALWKVDQEFKKTIKGIAVPAELTDHEKQRIAAEYTNNLKLYIQKWTEEEIVKLRKEVQRSAEAGNRYESLVGKIQVSYGVSQNKAKFLARQETSLLMTKFKQTRYEAAGVNEYKWGCVAGSKNHPVRPWHKKLEGKVFRWDDPPITTEPGTTPRRNNPGQDYNCRCFAKPIVKF